MTVGMTLITKTTAIIRSSKGYIFDVLSTIPIEATNSLIRARQSLDAAKESRVEVSPIIPFWII